MDPLDLQQAAGHLCEMFEGADWDVVGDKLGRLGKWEFEDYQPRSDSKR